MLNLSFWKSLQDGHLSILDSSLRPKDTKLSTIPTSIIIDNSITDNSLGTKDTELYAISYLYDMRCLPFVRKFQKFRMEGEW